MKLNEQVRRAMSWGRFAGVECAVQGELPGMSVGSLLPSSFRDDRIGDAIRRAYEDSYFDGYLTKATGKTTKDVWDERGPQQ